MDASLEELDAQTKNVEIRLRVNVASEGSLAKSSMDALDRQVENPFF